MVNGVSLDTVENSRFVPGELGMLQQALVEQLVSRPSVVDETSDIAQRDHDYLSLARGPAPVHLDGLTRGEDAVDSNGNLILDANNEPTIAGTGLYREFAKGTGGKLLFDHLGRRCFRKKSEECWLDSDPRAVNVDCFSSAHRALKVEYAALRGTPVDPSVSKAGGKYLLLGKEAAELTVYLSLDRTKCYTINWMTSDELFDLPIEDQKMVAMLFAEIPNLRGRLDKLGLVLASESVGIQKNIEQYLDSTFTDPRYGMRPNYAGLSDKEISREKNRPDSLYMNHHHVRIYREQVGMLMEDLKASPFTNQRVVNTKFTDLLHRYKLACSLSLGAIRGKNERTVHNNVLVQVRSLDKGQEYDKYFLSLIQKEQRLLKCRKVTVTLRNQTLDGTLYTAAYFAYMNMIHETEASIKVTEVDALNHLTKEFNAMLLIINHCQKSFVGTDISKQTRTIAGGESTDISALANLKIKDLGADPMRVVSMFDSMLERTYPTPRPVNDFFDVSRPTSAWFEVTFGMPFWLRSHPKSTYDAMSRAIASALNITNQQTVIRTATARSYLLKSARSFEAASQAQKRLSEAVTNYRRANSI